MAPYDSNLAELVQDGDWSCLKYTGGMSTAAKAAATMHLNDPNHESRILLMGLKCGSLGLNLTAANRVICVDPWFNNAVENQAFARTWRIGQTKQTEFVQVVVKDTVDERLMRIKANKQERINKFGREDDGPGAISHADLMGLFGKVQVDEDGKEVIVPYEHEDEDFDEQGPPSDDPGDEDYA